MRAAFNHREDTSGFTIAAIHLPRVRLEQEWTSRHWRLWIFA
jgi:hypothetical protein